MDRFMLTGSGRRGSGPAFPARPPIRGITPHHDELTGVLGKAWYVFFDPKGPGDIAATITFASVITGVFITKAALDGSNATYGAPGINYGTSLLIGLESNTDSLSIVGNVLTIRWHAIDPGDHIRVFTQATTVPEAETYALFMAGLLAVGFIARRRAPAARGRRARAVLLSAPAPRPPRARRSR